MSTLYSIIKVHDIRYFIERLLFKGELERKNTFENRVLSEEPKFVRKRRKQAHSEDVSTFEKENG